MQKYTQGKLRRTGYRYRRQFGIWQPRQRVCIRVFDFLSNRFDNRLMQFLDDRLQTCLVQYTSASMGHSLEACQGISPTQIGTLPTSGCRHRQGHCQEYRGSPANRSLLQDRHLPQLLQLGLH